MELSDPITSREKKIKNLELEMNDLRQGLTTVKDIYYELNTLTPYEKASVHIEQVTALPLDEDDREFEGLWRFHQDVLIPEPSAFISCANLYDAFIRYCSKTGRDVVEQGAFECVFARLKNPHPVLYRGTWKGYRLKNI
jgi:hypothetical protein